MFTGVKKAEELHHAYLLEGEREMVFSSLAEFLEGKLRIALQGNPDMQVRDSEVLTIDEGRELKRLASERAIGEGPKVFVVSFQSATKEAQNALLKLFEEPTAHTHFFVIVPQLDILLPTLQSRLYIIRSKKMSSDITLRAKQFLRATTPERLSILETIIKEKDKGEALQLLQEIEGALHADVAQLKGRAAALKEIERLRQYLYDRSPSVKMLLEHVALTVPRNSEILR